MERITTEVLVVGGGTGGTAAAIQSARRGASTLLATEWPWLGGMLTSAGVSAPDGNELAAFQTGLWGAFLRELRQRQPGGLDHAWVSFFTYDPQVGSDIFADWVNDLPNLNWQQLGAPLAVTRLGDRLTEVHFAEVIVQATVIIDGTELGDLLALAEIPHRWGWDWRSPFDEPSAPTAANDLTDRYPVQAPTWVVVMQEFAATPAVPEIAATSLPQAEFSGAWEGYGAESFLNYGRLPGQRFMINWPQQGNDYGDRLQRLVGSPAEQRDFWQEAQAHSQQFARYIQQELGQQYGLANVFPEMPHGIGGGALALHPYFRESRRLQGITTVREQDILPQPQGQVAALPVNADGQTTAIALGNYANDHHYPGFSLPLQPKSLRWGGRWTGTPFSLPYGCLVPERINGLLVCDKNISVSHIANGATRLQPIVLGIGQAAGMAAALCIEHQCQPRDLSVRSLQEALITDPLAPAAVIPLFNLPPTHPDWLTWQQTYLDHPDRYPNDGNCPLSQTSSPLALPETELDCLTGEFLQRGNQDYTLALKASQRPEHCNKSDLSLVTLHADIHAALAQYKHHQSITVYGRLNRAGHWFLVESIQD